MNALTKSLLFLFIAGMPTAHGATDLPAIDLGFTPDFVDFSPDDKYMVAENESRYLVWNVETGIFCISCFLPNVKVRRFLIHRSHRLPRRQSLI